MLCLYYCGDGMEDNLARAKQVRIDFRPNDETFKRFIETYQDKTIYIRINDENIFKSADEMRKLQEISPDLRSREYPFHWMITERDIRIYPIFITCLL